MLVILEHIFDKGPILLMMLEHIFDRGSTLLMDKVGVGKMVQALAVIALMMWYRAYFECKGHFSGTFGECLIDVYVC